MTEQAMDKPCEFDSEMSERTVWCHTHQRSKTSCYAHECDALTEELNQVRVALQSANQLLDTGEAVKCHCMWLPVPPCQRCLVLTGIRLALKLDSTRPNPPGGKR